MTSSAFNELRIYEKKYIDTRKAIGISPTEFPQLPFPRQVLPEPDNSPTRYFPKDTSPTGHFHTMTFPQPGNSPTICDSNGHLFVPGSGY